MYKWFNGRSEKERKSGRVKGDAMHISIVRIFTVKKCSSLEMEISTWARVYNSSVGVSHFHSPCAAVRKNVIFMCVHGNTLQGSNFTETARNVRLYECVRSHKQIHCYVKCTAIVDALLCTGTNVYCEISICAHFLHDRKTNWKMNKWKQILISFVLSISLSLSALKSITRNENILHQSAI